MAKYVSNKTAARWNRTSDVVEAAGAGNHFVSGLYRPPRGTADEVCEELDLSVGSYRATAGATIAPGETGPIQVNGGEECAEVIVDAVNHSECTFYLGERITAHVDKCCTAWFTGCSCCGGEQTPPDCCDRSIAICIGGELQIVSVNGGSASWDVSECCDCEGATLEITIACVTEGETTTITATWTYTCGESESTGTIDLSSLCNDEADVEILDEISGVCDGNLQTRFANFVEDCVPCETYTSICEDGACVTSITDGGVFTPNGQPFDVLNITSSSFSFSRMSLQPGDIFRIEVELSKIGNDDSENFSLGINMPGCFILDWSPTTDPSFLAPPVVAQRTVCEGNSSILWQFTFEADTVRTFYVMGGFDGCVIGASPAQVFRFTGQNNSGPSTEIKEWTISCAECP